jgi:hypothetical protein
MLTANGTLRNAMIAAARWFSAMKLRVAADNYLERSATTILSG